MAQKTKLERFENEVISRLTCIIVFFHTSILPYFENLYALPFFANFVHLDLIKQKSN